VAKTCDPVRIGYLQSVLADAGIESFIFDAAAGALWPGAIPRRLMVEDHDGWRARRVIEAAEMESDPSAS
jgi:Putative prokaryotic signal transducing protein